MGSNVNLSKTIQKCTICLISLACVSSETHNLQRVFRPGGVVPYIGYMGMRGAKGYGFSAVLVWNRVSISTILVRGVVCGL